MKKITFYISLIIILLFCLFGHAQEKTTVLKKGEIEQAIDKACQLLKRFYVFKEMEEKKKKEKEKSKFTTI